MTGIPAAGKGTFKQLLEEELDLRHISHQYYSLSDELRAEARLRGLPVDREVLRDIGHELRLKDGAGVLSCRVLDQIAIKLRQGLRWSVSIIDAIRNPAEATLLRERLAPDFVLVAVEAPIEAVIERIRARAREGDVVHTDDLAERLLTAEMGLDEPEHGHNIEACIEMADFRIDNSGPLTQLRERVQTFVEQQVVPFA